MRFCQWCTRRHHAPVCWPAASDPFIDVMRRPMNVDLPLACGDCESMPCTCDYLPEDIDLAWLPTLADHDVFTAEPVRCAA